MNSIIDVLMGIPTYSEELGLDLNSETDRFLWFLASILFAKKISSYIAEKTFKIFLERNLTTPYKILETGWDGIVDILDSGGYVRYDFSTASNIIDSMNLLVEKYDGDIDKIHDRAKDHIDLEKRLIEFKGIGPVAINIFLRELRGIWSMAKPKPSKLSLEVASRIGLEGKDIEVYESRLVRINIKYCKKKKCNVCPVRNYCREWLGHAENND